MYILDIYLNILYIFIYKAKTYLPRLAVNRLQEFQVLPFSGMFEPS